MTKKVYLFALLVMFLSSCVHEKTAEENNLTAYFGEQLNTLLSSTTDSLKNPRTLETDGTLRTVKPRDWTSGFFPGCLWMQYELTHDEYWKEQAEQRTEILENQKLNSTTHDMGFKMFNSYGHGYRLTNNWNYKKILLQSARTLTKRYNPKVGCIRSWDHNADKWQFPVIIDNMMNLELLFWAYRQTRDSNFYNIAYSHALTTLENHFRPDESSYHVVNYDTLTGKVINKQTHQGYGHESAWARGQAWGLYGFTMVFRETGDSIFLNKAVEIANFIINHENLPDDGVPYWDFNDPAIPDAPRDASAAAVICSGLYELSLYDYPKGNNFKPFADKIFASLSSPTYKNSVGENQGFLLKHSTGNYPKNDEIDAPIIYADYYFMEAALRKIKIEGFDNKPEAQIILKLDDLKPDKENGVHPRWQKVVDNALANNLQLSIGVVANTIEYGGDKYKQWFKKNSKSELLEFWNHGYIHKRWVENDTKVSEFRGTSLQKQVEHLKKAQQLMELVTGKKPVTFGAPYNHVDANTMKALEQFPELKVWLYADKEKYPASSKLILERIPALNIEYPVHRPMFYHVWNNLFFYRNNEFVVMQGHPMSWDNANFQQYKQILAYMQRAGFHITTPLGFYEKGY